ncbi:MAG: GNAT family protein [Candidatus Zixiibacteriota bacterium]
MIEGENINLRLVREDEISPFVNAVNKFSDIGDYWPEWFAIEQQERERFKKNNFWEQDMGKLHVVDKDDNLIGAIMFFKSFLFMEGYEIAYRIINPENRGKGYMSEALQLFVSYLFKVRPINRFYLRIFPDNKPSRRIAEKCGFIHEGTLRQAMFHEGNYIDCVIYGIIREDWEKKR